MVFDIEFKNLDLVIKRWKYSCVWNQLQFYDSIQKSTVNCSPISLTCYPVLYSMRLQTVGLYWGILLVFEFCLIFRISSELIVYLTFLNITCMVPNKFPVNLQVYLKNVSNCLILLV